MIEDPNEIEEARTPSRPDGTAADAAENRADEDRDGTPTGDEILGTLLGEASLWPLLIVMLGSLGSFGAAMLVLALVDRNPFAGAALLLLAGMSADQLNRARSRPSSRNIAKIIVLFWIVAALLATIAVVSGIA